MKERDMRKLKRVDLLELLVAEEKENSALKGRIKELEDKLRIRRKMLDDAGTVAEVTLLMNRVYDSAEKAARQYVENVKRMYGGKAEKESSPEGELDAGTQKE